MMTEMKKQIDKLIDEGVEFKVDKTPYGGWYVKYPIEKILMNGSVHKSTFCAHYTKEGKYLHPNRLIHVSAI
jgi:hypothetical protein